MYNEVSENINGLNQAKALELADLLNNTNTKLQSLNGDVGRCFSKLKKTDEELDAELSRCDEYEEKISAALRSLKMVNFSPHPVNDSNSGAGSSKLKLPEIPLPYFLNLKSESLDKFFASFKAIVQKYSLNSFEKFILLEKQLSSEPLMLIRSLGSENQSYDAAKNLLSRAFSFPVNKQFYLIKRLTELKLDFPGEPYAFISEMRTLADSLGKLDVGLRTFLQYFVWEGLNNKFRDILINITTCTKPSFDAIEANIFQATDRYLVSVNVTDSVPVADDKFIWSGGRVKHNLSPEKKFHVGRFKPCVLCKSDKNLDHPIFKCMKYPTAKAKVDRLKELRCCVRCTSYDHSSFSLLFQI